MKNILITGGPVHARLDAVKVITNRFKGGLMCDLAEKLASYDTQVTYLCAPKVGAQIPKTHHGIEVVTHTGFDDYHNKVLELAPRMDAVILGAAVANLIPVKPWKGKFPSHNYKPGDVIPIDFMVAPRVISDVKEVAPNTHLFGYKLLDDVSYDELVHAAYGIVLEARATAVIANDATNLLQKYAVTKERGVHPLAQEDLAPWLWNMINDEYYTTVLAQKLPIPKEAETKILALIERYKNRFVSVETGLIFGTVAVRHGSGFVTTGRGKKELESLSYVTRVNHAARKVYGTVPNKPSLNAPLLSWIFANAKVDFIVHHHEQSPGLPTYAYAPPGTVRDTKRNSATSFNIEGHGCMLLFDAEGNQL